MCVVGLIPDRKKTLIGSDFLPDKKRNIFFSPTSSLCAGRRCGEPFHSLILPSLFVTSSCHTTCAAHRHDVSRKASQSFPRASQPPRRGTTSRPLRTSAAPSFATSQFPFRLEFAEQELIVVSALRTGSPPVPRSRDQVHARCSLAYFRDRDRRAEPLQRTLRHAPRTKRHYRCHKWWPVAFARRETPCLRDRGSRTGGRREHGCQR